MKKLAALIPIVMLLLVACTPVFTSVYAPDINNETSAGIGDVFFSHKEGNGFQDAKDPFIYNAFRFDLTVVELSPQKLGLQYNEYTRVRRPVNDYNGRVMYYETTDWLIKEGFNKRFDFDLSADKIIRYKEFEFEVVSVENGRIKYKRIK